MAKILDRLDIWGPSSSYSPPVGDYSLTIDGNALQVGFVAGNSIISFGPSTSVQFTNEPIINNPLQVVNKQYVDSVAAGLDPKEAVHLAATGSINIYSAPIQIDGHTCSVGDRILLWKQDGTENGATANGIYVWNGVGATMTRSSDMDGTPASEVSTGNYVFVTEGNTYKGSGFVIVQVGTKSGILTPDVDVIKWTKVSGATDYTWGTGLQQTGNEISVNTSIIQTISAFNSAVSGNTNYVPKFVGSNAIGNSAIYDSSGNIGIGTTTPTNKLDVNGIIRSFTGSNVIYMSPSSQSLLYMSSTDFSTLRLLGDSGASDIQIVSDNGFSYLQSNQVFYFTNGSNGSAAKTAWNPNTGNWLFSYSGGAYGGASSNVKVAITSGTNSSSNYELLASNSDGINYFQLRSDKRLIYLDGNQGLNKILTSDASGVATWQTLTITGNGVTASGTASYISKFTGTNTLGNSQIFDNGTNVGIGTTSPNYILDIRGQFLGIKGSSGQYAGVRFDATSNAGGKDYALLSTGTSWATGAGYFALYNFTDSLGLFNITPTGNITLQTTNLAYSNNAKLHIINYTGNTNVLRIDGTASNNNFVVRDDGNVGIGVASPSKKLEVTGTASINGDFMVDTNVLFVDSTNNRVGIGTASPSTPLHVIGDVTVLGTLYATSKSFDIQHPSDPSKRLTYASLEGPENGVYVRGRLDKSNIIELPYYWVDLVDETTITVQLTPNGYFQELFVDKIEDNKVYVGSPALPNCFYTVYAERKDIPKLKVE